MQKNLSIAWQLVFCATLSSACVSEPQKLPSGFSEALAEPAQNKRTPAAADDSGARDWEKTIYLDQNWTAKMREQFYRMPQGSHILPLKFALALEKSGSMDAFFSSQNLAGFGFIPQKKDPETNPYSWPVGFTIDGKMKFDPLRQHSVENGERMLGITCAACHTGSLHYQGQALRIDGGQGLIDFQSFVKGMDYALRETREDSAKLDRFLDRVMAADPANERAKLITELDAVLKERGMWTNLNHNGMNYGAGFNETSFQYGPGRNDAFAIIFNEVLARDLGVPANAGEPNAPVSIPVIWDAPHADWLQWNGLASNSAAEGGPIARNLGQVLGVFGHIDFSSRTRFLDGYCSSARRQNLEALEELVRKLWSPEWPSELFGTLDPGRVAHGKELFAKSCVGCHDPINRMDPNRQIKSKLIPMAEVGTETKFNDNALGRIANTSTLAGKLTRLVAGRPMEQQEPAATVLRYAVAGAIAGSISIASCENDIDISGSDVVNSWLGVARAALNGRQPTQQDDNPDKATRTAALIKKLAVYKARPLNGIWASPPFFHNGSVNSIYDVLLPPNERKNFYLGCDDYDPEKLGLKCGAGPKAMLMDVSIRGNTPVGHDYGPKGDSAENDRMDLLEYLKSL